MLVLGPGSTHLITANLWSRYGNIESCVAVHNSAWIDLLIYGFSQVNARLLITCGTAFYAIMFVIWLLCYMDPVLHCDHLVREKGADYFAFHWFAACVPSAIGYLLFVLMTMVGYDLCLWLFLDIYFTMLNEPSPASRLSATALFRG